MTWYTLHYHVSRANLHTFNGCCHYYLDFIAIAHQEVELDCGQDAHENEHYHWHHPGQGLAAYSAGGWPGIMVPDMKGIFGARSSFGKTGMEKKANAAM